MKKWVFIFFVFIFSLVLAIFVRYNIMDNIALISTNKLPTCTCCRSSYLNSELKLDSLQKVKFAKLDRKFNKNSLNICERLCSERERLAELIIRCEPDDERIEKSLKNISVLQYKLEKMVVKHLHDIKGILNKDQKKEFFSLIQKELRSR